jgi:hypothetical protein
MKDFSALQEISRNPERLRGMIVDELEMEGYAEPKIKVTLFAGNRRRIDQNIGSGFRSGF